MLSDQYAPPNKAPGPRVRPVPAVSRAIDILRLLGRNHEPMTLKGISQELELVTSTCLHILRVLVDEGLVKLDPATKRYTLGVGLLALARSVMESNTFASLAQPALNRLASRWASTMIGVEVAGSEHFVAVALSRSQAPFSLHVDVGSRFPSLISATGRLIAAYTNLSEEVIEERFKALRWDQAPDIEVWRQEVQSVRRKGYSIDRGNYISGVVVIAVPVFDARDRLTSALVCAGLADHIGGQKSVAVAKDLQEEANEITKLLAKAR